MVVALGAMRDPDAIPGFRDHAIDVYDAGASVAGAAAIDAFAGGRIVIGVFGAPYPCPPGPYELALLLAERMDARGTPGGIFVFTPQPGSLPILGTDACASFDGRLANAGITFRPKTQATSVEAGAVLTADGTRIPFDLLLGVPPHRVPPVVAAAGLTGPSGWVAVDARTLETRFPGVSAIGDVTAIPLANGMPLPKAGVFAHAEGEVVAARIADALGGREPTATFSGQGMCFLETGHGGGDDGPGRLLRRSTGRGAAGRVGGEPGRQARLRVGSTGGLVRALKSAVASRSAAAMLRIASRTRGGVAGTRSIRTPVAWRIAPRIAGAVAMIAGSPTPFAPKGPAGSASSMRRHSMSGTSPIVGIR